MQRQRAISTENPLLQRYRFDLPMPFDGAQSLSCPFCVQQDGRHASDSIAFPDKRQMASAE